MSPRPAIVCSKCGKTFSSSIAYHQHRVLGYPCGPTARGRLS